MAKKGAQIVVTGHKEIDRKLKKLKEATIGKKCIRPGLRVTAKIVKKEVVRNCPVDTSALKRAIKVKAGKRSRKAITVHCMMGDQNFTGPTFYGGFQEWGWLHGKRGTENRGPKIEGKLFMTRAYKSKKKEATQAGIKEMLRRIDKEIKKAA
jgi:HK97 gp10 family phage protein